MNYGMVRDQVLMLLNQHTIAGNPVSPAYNNQQDYLNRIPALVNDAVMEIATTVRKIPTVLRLEDLEQTQEGEQVRYTLPENFYQLISGSIVKTDRGTLLHTNLYTIRGRKYLVVPKEEAGSYQLDYYRYPNLLGPEPADTDELDNEPDTHCAVPFYVAAFLADHDDPWLASLFNNKYEDKLAKLTSGRTAEIRPAADTYRFFG